MPPPRQNRLALAIYMLLIIAGSLYPLRELRFPEEGLLEFLFAPVSTRFSRADLVTNVLLYLPLGFLLVRARKAGMRRRAAVPLAVAAGALLSLLLESCQSAIPGRIASNLDLAGNTVGTALGAALAALGEGGRWPGTGLTRRRYDWFLPGAKGDWGLALLVLWLFAQLSLQPPALVGGRLHQGFVPFWEGWRDLEGLRIDHALLFGLDLAGFALYAMVQLRPARRSARALAAFALAGLGTKLLCAFALIKSSVLGRAFSLEILGGIALAAALLAYLPRTDSLRQPQLPAIALLACLAAVWWLVLTLGLPGALPRPTGAGLPNVTTAAFAVSVAWPALALAQLAWLSAGRPGR